jgi:glycine/D-amino acid oxidase-like deaminating enzyme
MISVGNETPPDIDRPSEHSLMRRPESKSRVAVIGGGFFGAMVALRLSGAGLAVTIIEREPRLMARASYINQARIHGGYHYPRSILTARRSRANYARYLADFPSTVVGGLTHVYAIPRVGSKVSAGQFVTFCRRINAPIHEAPDRLRGLFASRLVEDVYTVDEAVFDADALRVAVTERLDTAQVDLRLATEALRFRRVADRIVVECDRGPAIEASLVFNCTYAGLNRVLERAGMDALPLKLEYAEMAIVDVPPALEHTPVTVMDGPFFSVMPFPPAGAHTLTHVRYTPRLAYVQDPGDFDPGERFPPSGRTGPTSQAALMLRDARRFLLPLAEAVLLESWSEVKAVLVTSEADDSRPILMSRSRESPGFVSILGSKIDNVYDVLEAVDAVLGGTTP